MKRQPKGVSTGGQFAPDVNAESTVLLESDVEIMALLNEAAAGPSKKYHCDDCDVVSFEEIHDCGATCREIDPDDAESMGLDETDGLEPAVDHCDYCENDGHTFRTCPKRDDSEARSSPNPDGEGDYVDDGFAADLELINNPRPIIEQSERWIADTRENIQRILDAKAAREAGGGDTLDQLIEEGEIIDILKERIIRYQQDIVDAQRKELEALRKDREENPSLKDIVCMRTFGYLDEGDDVEEADDASYGGRGAQGPLSRETIAADYERYLLDDNDRDFDGAFQGIDYVVESLVDWRIADQAKVDKERLEAVSARGDRS